MSRLEESKKARERVPPSAEKSQTTFRLYLSHSQRSKEPAKPQPPSPQSKPEAAKEPQLETLVVQRNLGDSSLDYVVKRGYPELQKHRNLYYSFEAQRRDCFVAFAEVQISEARQMLVSLTGYHTDEMKRVLTQVGQKIGMRLDGARFLGEPQKSQYAEVYRELYRPHVPIWKRK